MIDITDSVVRTLEAASRLRPTPGFVNGDEYAEWYVEASSQLLLALADLAQAQDEPQLARQLELFSHPLCMEPLDAVLPTEAMPKTWCFNPVKTADTPCALHTPERAADLGRCTWTGDGALRMCRTEPAPGDDRCKRHAEFCRAVKVDGAVCGRPRCRIPQHQMAPVPGAC
ncbi:hypothetical protein [Streptomyces smyrnaeus]|uniref:Uncharacterized protein n=1 Tax=Streptomyces smyrnaeus TaxID=1387713 RepID=A0ABS3Y6B2_9ACTN|nr:hypothetical protein [Streptomyces smyrnaeus]MBO8202672.1 hypothetical protein [Streptomyces smyrnaeus]